MGTLADCRDLKTAPHRRGLRHGLHGLAALEHPDGVDQDPFSINVRIDPNDQAKEWFFRHAIMDAMQEARTFHHPFLIRVNGSLDDERSWMFALGCFLLLRYAESRFQYVSPAGTHYCYPESASALGEPLSQHHFDGQLHQRDFTRGKVLVNVCDTPVTCWLDHEYRDHRGGVVRQLHLGHYQAAILLEITDDQPELLERVGPSLRARNLPARSRPQPWFRRTRESGVVAT